ncbi:MAG: signal peptidase II [Acidimicrobiaceae bacterium]|nr:signal peptidase II [Acidimicrobiaceae bacterium]MXZ98257.1 signal peptidase II [Acidimicrobiaceae bacterium]MYE76362.1 signal peptidase II [Acidimicrobiaceae bacterium]MYE96383.1 signal peptidase II [Acidimicrobiaceae bacterium]MYH42367.1 signal peptidase II [Acidimicrobiaceae bacterium]
MRRFRSPASGPSPGPPSASRSRRAASVAARAPGPVTTSTGPSAHFLRAVIAAASVVGADQLTKWWALQALDDGRVINLVWTLRLRLVFNTGAAFSSFQGLGPLLGVAAVAIAAVLLFNRRLGADRWSATAAGCIAGGALGNLADRLLRSNGGFLDGAVVDFIDVQWWPVWNVADMGVVLGGAALVWHAYRRAR